MIIVLKKHMEMIIQKAYDYYPSPIGGLIGGRGNIILGIFPLANNYDLAVKNPELFPDFHPTRHPIFIMSTSGIIEGQQFFKTKGIDYLGIYRTQTDTPPTLNRNDLRLIKGPLGHILVIISMLDKYNPKIRVFRADNSLDKNEAIEEALNVIEEKDLNKYIS